MTTYSHITYSAARSAAYLFICNARLVTESRDADEIREYILKNDTDAIIDFMENIDEDWRNLIIQNITPDQVEMASYAENDSVHRFRKVVEGILVSEFTTKIINLDTEIKEYLRDTDFEDERPDFDVGLEAGAI